MHVHKWTYVGLNFKLDVGLYRLDQQVACQRIGKTFIDAKSTKSVVADLFAKSKLSFNTPAFSLV